MQAMQPDAEVDAPLEFESAAALSDALEKALSPLFIHCRDRGCPGSARLCRGRIAEEKRDVCYVHVVPTKIPIKGCAPTPPPLA